ncbi:MAG: hypothetical protein KGL13_04030 [Gammaproteobacteria bacterium]|nr:hypothetical protein [Gammaproteobacteria bacterium]MDE2345617.1 hypothetical protein [Gammaproteobacteria bacterium]
MVQQKIVKTKYALEDEAGLEPDDPQAAKPVRISNSLTAAEASRRWCPFARIREYQDGHIEGTAVNRSFDSEDSAARGSLCLAGGCMAWRWDIGHAWDDTERRKEPRGYCGLAGQPF